MTTVVNSLVQWDGVFVSDSLNLSLLRALVAIFIAEVIIFRGQFGQNITYTVGSCLKMTLFGYIVSFLKESSNDLDLSSYLGF